ncbi:hypothetical protein A2960_00315 [Candidatus Gottesmanbacteria bacterium RIFCSPLOWO2_01_FULL_39_12b]|uniref:Uncharacterized protein n=1 Tax=Candidatus Gottesmanbacteria bacterium RIFCSPLOWO2_01_FULL_39_12b TaxID=1798388 RepID=A0A1F6ARD1_9BACT|nr:MAG: hypothetical protein A2960_00315 [Candidatus Gottesmanbacteria bacterium RIFCSPLOWO2_01_FULL_39_12b]
MTKKNQNKKTQLIVFVIIIVVIVTVIYYIQQAKNYLPQASPPDSTYQNTSIQTVNSVSDLDKTLTELESSDINQIDQGLSENDSDASNF